MAADVQPLQQIKLLARPSSLTPEQTYWRSFKSPLNVQSPTNSAVTHITQPPLLLLPACLDIFALTTGARVQIYSQRTRKLLKTITRFNDTAHSGELRQDGRVLVAGDDTGTIQVFDVNSRAILKTWKECKQPVWSTKWSASDNTALMSCCDDKTVRLWDLPSDSSITVFRGHQDYVRTGCFIPGSGKDLMVSGSYDETVRIWDSRASKTAVMTFKHVASVESVLPMSSGCTILASAGNQIAVLDLIAGRPLHMIRNHQKTVTSLCLASQGTRLVSGGLDGHLKVFETDSWQVVAGSKYPSAILSMSVLRGSNSTEDKHIAVGMSSGNLSLKTRLSGEEKQKTEERQREMDALVAGTIDDYDKRKAKKRTRGWERRLRGVDYAGEDADIVIQGNDRGKIKKPKDWELALRKGEYPKALDLALKTHDNLIILTLLEQLRYRSALSTSLEGRDEVTMIPIMSWIFRQMVYPSFTSICVELSMSFMDLYSKHLGQSTELWKHFVKLHGRVKEEVGRARAAHETQGMLQLVALETPG